MAISMLKIRRPLGRLIFNMGMAIPGKTVFLIETAPSTSNTAIYRMCEGSVFTNRSCTLSYVLRRSRCQRNGYKIIVSLIKLQSAPTALLPFHVVIRLTWNKTDKNEHGIEEIGIEPINDIRCGRVRENKHDFWVFVFYSLRFDSSMK